MGSLPDPGRIIPKIRCQPFPKRFFLFSPASPCGTADVNLHATDGKPLRPPLDPQFLLTGILTFGAFTSIKQVDENHVSILQPQKKKLVTLWELIY